MATTLQIKRGSNASNSTFTGASGELSFDTDRKTIRVHDGSTAGGFIIGVAVGSILPFGGASLPFGYLFCYGQSLSTSTYSILHGVFGYTYGGSGGSFNLPDLRGRVVAGQDDMGGTSANRLTGSISGSLNGDTLGGTGGEEAHTLTVTEMPSHQHSVYYHAGYQGGTVEGANGGDAGTRVFGGVTSPVGGGGSHNNVQPTLILNYIVKYL